MGEPDEDPVEEIVKRFHETGSLSSADIGQLFRASFNFKRSKKSYATVCGIMLNRGEYVALAWRDDGGCPTHTACRVRRAPTANHTRPLLACDIVTTALAYFPGDTDLRQLHGLALAQAGCTLRAMGVLEELRASGDTREETDGVLARCYKDLASEADTPARRQMLYTKAYDVYKEAYVSGNRSSFYTGELASACRAEAPAFHPSLRRRCCVRLYQE